MGDLQKIGNVTNPSPATDTGANNVDATATDTVQRPLMPILQIVRTCSYIPKGNDWMPPTGYNSYRIDSPFGYRNTGIQGATTNHQGIDIGCPSGTPVYAPLDGLVMSAQDTTPNGCGGFVKLNHMNYETKFCHLKQWVVTNGEKVKKGQVKITFFLHGDLLSSPCNGRRRCEVDDGRRRLCCDGPRVLGDVLHRVSRRPDHFGHHPLGSASLESGSPTSF